MKLVFNNVVIHRPSHLIAYAQYTNNKAEICSPRLVPSLLENFSICLKYLLSSIKKPDVAHYIFSTLMS